MRYHLNRDDEVKPCRASAGNCPFMSDEEHFDSEGEAQMHYEQMMMGSRSDALQKAQENALFGVHEVLRNTELKRLDAAELSQTFIKEATQAGFDETAIRSSVGLATILHAHQKRGNRGEHSSTPYIEHPLRNSLRLVRWGVKDQDVIVAATLHDTVEDGSKQYVEKFEGREPDEPEARKALGEHIRKTYGREVHRIVMGVTNDYVPKDEARNKTREQKNKEYFDHVSSNIKNDRGVYLVKLSDFVDNASSLHHNDVPGSKFKVGPRASKYAPMVPVFKREGKKLDLEISKSAKSEIFQKLDKTEMRLKNIIAKSK